ncbi:MAG: flavin reductase family protein [Lachnospiraceae bacterium]|nr:flavin reductase family protein [Lachnospiraceae bacterium]
MKNIGSTVGLYPTPDTVVGTVQDGRINWMNVAHVGVWGVDCMMLSIGKPHYTARALHKGAHLSVNLVDEDMMVRADYVGIVSGEMTDKSDVFPVFHGQLDDAPLIENAPVAMECVIEEIHETKTHFNCIVRPVNTYAREDVLSENGKIDFEKIHPILFEMQQTRFLRTGDAVGRCWDIGKKLIDQ